MSTIGVLRDNFNPPHYGDLFKSVYYLKSIPLDYLLICPTYKESCIESTHCYEMVERIFLGFTQDVHKAFGIPNEYGFIDTDDSLNYNMSIISWDYQNKLGTNEGLIKIVHDKLPNHDIVELNPNLSLFNNYDVSIIKHMVNEGTWDSLAYFLPHIIIQYIQTYNLYKEITVVPKTH